MNGFDLALILSVGAVLAWGSQYTRRIVMYRLWRGDGKDPCAPGFSALEASAAVVLIADGKHMAMVNVAAKFPPKVAPLVSPPPKYTLPGGYAESGENIIETMIREVREETGLVVDQSRPIVHLGGFQSELSRWPRVKDRYTVFGCYATADSKLCIGDTKEVLHVQWIAVELLNTAVAVYHTVKQPSPTPFEHKISVNDASGKLVEFGYLSIKWFARSFDKKYPPRPVENGDYHSQRLKKTIALSYL